MKKSSYTESFKIRRKFRKVLEDDYNGASIGTVKRAMNAALGPLPYINWPMDKSWAVIRARDIDESIEDITKPETFGAPPIVETSQGRANLVNHPVFYGTFDSRTAMQEIDVPLDTECYVSIWEFKKKTPIVTTFLSSIDKKNDLFHLNNLTLKDVPDGLKDDYTKKTLELGLKLRASAFTTSNYEFTSKIAHDIIYNNNAASDGLIYPSVVDPYRCNIALNPFYVASNMECVRVYKYVWSGAFIFNMRARGSLQDNKIIWEEIGSFELDAVDYKYSGSFGPNEIHSSALDVLHQK